MNKDGKTDSKTAEPDPVKYWSGRRESNPRMQLGKLGGSQVDQWDGCKTGDNATQDSQEVTAEKQNLESCSSGYCLAAHLDRFSLDALFELAGHLQAELKRRGACVELTRGRDNALTA